MSVGKVTINTSIKDVSEGRKYKHLLRFDIANPLYFTESIMSSNPAACLKFRRKSLTEPLKNDFLGVCSIDDFMTLSESGGGTGAIDEIFRSSSFYAEYSDYNTSLADQKKMELQVWDFYNNLNAYTVAEDGAEANRKYTFPDYTEELLNSLISRRRLLIFQNATASDTIKIIENVIIPMLSSNYTLYESLDEAVELLLSNAESHKNNLVDMVQLKDGIVSVQSNLQRFSQLMQFDSEKMARIQGKTATLNTYLESVMTDTDDLVIAKNRVAEIYAESKVSDPVASPDVDTFPTIASKVMPGISFITSVETDYFTDLTTIDTLVDLIEKFGQNLTSEIKTKEGEVTSLKDDIETRKAEIQGIEARLRSIRPSIDLVNPETAWYLTVNVDNG
jgi:hypothetical protein